MFYSNRYTLRNYKVLINRLFAEKSDMLTPEQQLEIREKISKCGYEGSLFDNLITKATEDNEVKRCSFPHRYYRKELG